MTFARLTIFALLVLFNPVAAQQSPQPDWSKIEEETMRHFQAILRLDTSNPPGNEGIVVEYLKSVLDREGIETNLRARSEAAKPRGPFAWQWQKTPGADYGEHGRRQS